MTDPLMHRQRGRKCRTCSACCTTHAIAELKKPEGQACEHMATGWKPCRIYVDRPTSCREFECLWLQGALGEGDRPDLIGLVLDFESHPKYGPTFKVFEAHAGAARQVRGETVMQALAKHGLVLVFERPSLRRRMYGGPERATRLFVQDFQLAIVSRSEA